ncbi:MAG TPA: MFS transporter, partial [Pseudomonadota bacterium]|nr:MFS transporter [Pseudomonadota bacterium]
MAQGLPFGFQKELSSFLRETGVSLDKIGFTRALSAPWMAKALWAPLVDRFGSERFGRRKSWIVPMLILLGLTC